MSDRGCILDARCERVREAGVIRSRAVLVAIGIDWEGRRQVLAVELANREAPARGATSSSVSSNAVWRACTWSSPTITKASRRPWPKSSAAPAPATQTRCCRFSPLCG